MSTEEKADFEKNDHFETATQLRIWGDCELCCWCFQGLFIVGGIAVLASQIRVANVLLNCVRSPGKQASSFRF